MTRVYLFLEEKDFKFEAWDNASEEVKHCVADHHISVLPGLNSNHADISIHCGRVEISLKFSIRDLWQEKSLMLESLKQSVVEDYEDENYNYLDIIPSFGVVELCGIEFICVKDTTDAEIEAFMNLVDNFLLKHFMMYVFIESEIEPKILPIMKWNRRLKEFYHFGTKGYRVSTNY